MALRKKLYLAERLKKIYGHPEEVKEPVQENKVEDVVTKIEREFKYDLREVEGIKIKSVKDLEIQSEEISGLHPKGTLYDTSGDRLEQKLVFSGEEDLELKWTVIKDTSAEKFALIVKGNLKLLKANPVIFGVKTDEIILLSSHIGVYTVILGCYDAELQQIIDIFSSILKTKSGN